MGTLRKYQKEMVEITNVVAEMKHAFHRFISAPDRAKERIRNSSSKKAKRKKDGRGGETEQNIRELQGDFKGYNIGVLKYQRRESLGRRLGRQES